MTLFWNLIGFMRNDPCRVTVAGEIVSLLPERALYWSAQQTLFIADLHLGKSAQPETVTGDLNRLSRILANTGARRLVVLGDLLHATIQVSSNALRSFETWLERYQNIELVLVRGNHDRIAGDPPEDWGFDVVDPGLVMRPFVLYHEPPEQKVEAGFVMCGHVHPVVAHHIRRGQTAMLPCFWFRSRRLILPAFGSNTGIRAVQPKLHHRYYVIHDNRVQQVR